jgi:hypothetical protein
MVAVNFVKVSFFGRNEFSVDQVVGEILGVFVDGVFVLDVIFDLFKFLKGFVSKAG